MDTLDTPGYSNIVDLKTYATLKRENEKLYKKGEDEIIWKCNCGEELFLVAPRGFQCSRCLTVTLFKDWEG